MRIFLFLVLIAPFFSFGEDCKKRSWVTTTVTSEENDWFFFKGFASDMDKDFALLKARGMALNRVINNCEKIPAQTKILKTCKEEVGAGHQVFVQAAVFKGDCFETKLATPEKLSELISKDLTQEANFYNENTIQHNTPETLKCGPDFPKKCGEKGAYFFHLGNYPKALEVLEYSCEDGDMPSCFLGGFSSFLLNERSASFTLFRKNCRKKDSNACLFLGVLYEQTNNDILARKNYLKSCYFENPKGCLFLGKLTEKSKNLPGALKSYHEACLMNLGEGCKNAQRLLTKFPDIAEIFGQKACILKEDKVCFGMGLINLEKGKYQEALRFFKKSCDHGSPMGCSQTGEMVRIKNLTKAKTFYEKGCDIGDLTSCLSMAKIYEKKPEKFGYYSMISCVLDDLNSCFLWGKYLFEKDDLLVAKRILNSACERGQLDACALSAKI